MYEKGIIPDRSMLSSVCLQLLQEEKELKDVKTAVNGLVDVFKVGRVIF